MAQNIYQRRLLGQQPGVQVNMPTDRTDRLLPEVGDQTIAAVGLFSRGRIDQPFYVSPDKLQRYLGKPKSVRVDARNETYVQVFEAFRAGAAGAVISRLASDSAVNNWIVVSHGANAAANLSVSETLPTGGTWFVAIQMKDAITEGVYVQVSRGVSNANHVLIKIRERSKTSAGLDTNEGEILYEFEGSTVQGELDEDGNSAYIADVAEKFYGDWLEVEVNQTAAAIAANDSFATVTVGGAVVAFTDNVDSFTAENKQTAVKALGRTNIHYRYLISSSTDLTLVSELIALAQEYNRKLFIEVSGLLSPTAACAWIENFNYPSQGGMYFDWNWSPIRRDDPTGLSGNIVFGTVGQKAGNACARNAITNGFGLAKLNQPIAGKDYYIMGTRIKQIYNPDDVELAMLAKARINPAIYSEYHDGSGYVWADSFSGAKKNGISKLASASEIAIWAQDTWGKFGKSLLHKPMKEGLRLMARFSEKQLQQMEASDWLISSTTLNGAAFAYTVKPNERYPDDRLDTVLSLAIDGVVRVVTISTDMYSRD